MEVPLVHLQELGAQFQRGPEYGLHFIEAILREQCFRRLRVIAVSKESGVFEKVDDGPLAVEPRRVDFGLSCKQCAVSDSSDGAPMSMGSLLSDGSRWRRRL